MTICKGCGRPMEWGVTEDGTKIPLDPKPVIYAIRSTERLDGMVRVIKLTKGEAMCSHFSTCPKADLF